MCFVKIVSKNRLLCVINLLLDVQMPLEIKEKSTSGFLEDLV